MPKWFFPILILVLLAGLAVGYFIFQTPQFSNVGIPLPTPTSIPTLTPRPPTPIPTSIPLPTPTPDPRASWTTYRNSDLGFEISYPPKQEVVEDTYGWPNAVFMLYGGGQSYSLVVEAWDAPEEYESKYEHQMDVLTIKNVNGKYITLLNMNDEEEVDRIIATFKQIN